MNEARNKVVKNSVLYSVAQMFIKALGLIMLPLYTSTKFVPAKDYGEYSLLSQFVTLAVFFISLSLNHAAIRFYGEFKDDNKKVKRFFGTILTFVTLLGAAVMIVFIVFRKPLTSLLFTGIPFFPSVVLSLLSMVFYCIYNIYQGYLQSMQEGWRFARNGMGFVLTHLVFNILFIVFLRNIKIGAYCLGGINGLMISLTISYAIFACIGICDLMHRKYIEICIDKNMLKLSLKYSLPLVPHSFANNMAAYIPKVFLNKVDKAAGVVKISFTAIHSVAMQFSSIIDVAQSAINNAQRPWFNEKMKMGDKGKAEIVDFTMVAMRLVVVVCLAAGLFSQEVVLIVARSDAYYQAWKIVPVFALVHAVKCIYYNHTLAVMYDLRANNKMFLCSGIGTLVNFLLTGVLTWWVFDFNIWGSAISFFISRCVSAAITVFVCRKYKVINFPVRKMVSCVVVCGVALAAGILPFNWYYAVQHIGQQIEVFSSWYFINFAYKIIIFVAGSRIIVGDQMNEVTDFVKELLKRKKR